MIHQTPPVGQYPRTQNTPLYVTGRDKPVAFVNQRRRLLFKTVDGRKHFVKIPPGIAFDDDVLRQAGELGATDIEVTDGTSPHRDTYRTGLSTFLRHAEVVNRGHGRQLVLRFTYWRKNGAPSEIERQAEQQAAKQAAASVVQLGLFGGGL
ncbi:MAG: hypothetical protein DCC55_27965 [Chloroflexi bacterium]|nr:MAG: hypothetical protein DCC55_27965 [Chloroflexota bacterium]